MVRIDTLVFLSKENCRISLRLKVYVRQSKFKIGYDGIQRLTLMLT